MHMPLVKRRWTVADLEDLPEDGIRYEIIDGELFMTPAPTWRHQEAVSRLHRLLTDYLDVQRVGHAFFAPADVIFSPTRAVQPDIFVAPLVAGERPEHFNDVRRLLLAVEILSPSTARADRVAKRTLYRTEGVDEYWVVDLEARSIERSTPHDHRMEIFAEELTWLPAGATTPLVVDIAAYFSRVVLKQSPGQSA